MVGALGYLCLLFRSCSGVSEAGRAACIPDGEQLAGRRIWGATSRIHAAEFQDRPGTGIRSREFLRRRIREYLDYRVRARAGPRTAHQEHGEVYSNAE